MTGEFKLSPLFKEKVIPLVPELKEEQIEEMRARNAENPKGFEQLMEIYRSRRKIQIKIKRVKVGLRNRWNRRLNAINNVAAMRLEKVPESIDELEAWKREEEEAREVLYREILTQAEAEVVGVLIGEDRVSGTEASLEFLEEIGALELAGEAARKAQSPTEAQGES